MRSCTSSTCICVKLAYGNTGIIVASDRGDAVQERVGEISRGPVTDAVDPVHGNVRARNVPNGEASANPPPRCKRSGCPGEAWQERAVIGSEDKLASFGVALLRDSAQISGRKESGRGDQPACGSDEHGHHDTCRRPDPTAHLVVFPSGATWSELTGRVRCRSSGRRPRC
jgi:hypothetical protein